MYINATITYGVGRSYTCSIQETENNGASFKPKDLTDFSVKFKVLGSPTADAKVLLEHIITQNTDLEVDGQITNAENGEFTFTITAEDTYKLGFGHFPIAIDLLDANSLEYIDTITQGKEGEEFNKIYIMEV